MHVFSLPVSCVSSSNVSLATLFSLIIILISLLFPLLHRRVIDVVTVVVSACVQLFSCSASHSVFQSVSQSCRSCCSFTRSNKSSSFCTTSPAFGSSLDPNAGILKDIPNLIKMVPVCTAGHRHLRSCFAFCFFELCMLFFYHSIYVLQMPLH